MGMVRKGILVLVVVVAAVAAACTGGSGSGSGGGGEQAAAAPASVAVTLSDFKIEPANIQVPTDQPVTFAITNAGQSPHTFAVVVDAQTKDSGEIAPGGTGSLALDPLAAGSYDALCSVPGHDKLGMTATVTAAAGSTVASPADTTTGAVDPSSPMPNMTAQEMADMHKQGVEDFLAGNQTSSQGNQVLKPKIENGMKVFNLTVSQIQWEVSKGVFKEAMAFNGMVPGPEIRVQQGDKVKFVVQNQLDQPFVLHFHGLTVPNDMDGVPYVTQPPAMPGEYWTYQFTIKDPPGMYVYHSHFNSTEQVGMGLYGAVIVEPKGGQWSYPSFSIDANGYMKTGASPKVDDEYTMFLGDGPLGYVLNAKSFPATTPLVAKLGDWVLIHMANDGSLLHPMHLHGYHFEVVGQDGFPLDQPYMADTLVVAPGQRFDVLIHADQPGAWAFHCHILPHVEGPQGMYGMVTALVVQ